MVTEEYWTNLDEKLVSLIKYGHCQLPPISNLDLNSYSERISREANHATFSSLVGSHREFLSVLSVERYLVPKLYEIARDRFGFKGDISDQYHIARRVEAGNQQESYRAHFDSHLFTLVIPLKIPEATFNGSQGELIYLPNARKMPKSEFINIGEKLYWKKFANKKGVRELQANAAVRTANFLDYRPLLFVGNTTFHVNKPVSSGCSDYRLTLLSHFFDPSTSYGIGALLRKIRRR